MYQSSARRSAALFAAFCLLALLLPIAAGVPQAHAGATGHADIDGDGADDLAIGVPGENLDTGVAQVLYSHGAAGLIGDADGVVDESFTQNTSGADGTAEAGDRFTAALATGDFDADGLTDLAVGVPGENEAAGMVHVFYSSGPAGLVTPADGVDDESLTQDLPGANRSAEPGDLFGSTLAVGDFDGDGMDDLAVGVPGENRGSGAVQVFFSQGSAGLVAAAGTVEAESFTQNTLNANGVGEAGDRFGSALAAGDFNSDGLSDLAVGVPGENGGAGQAQVFYSQGPAGLITAGDGAVDESLHQDVPNADGVAEAGDRFGATLAVGDFDGDGADDLAVGGPGENQNAGVAQVFYSQGAGGLATAAGGVRDEAFSQDTLNANGSEEAGDLFGAALATGDFDGDGVDDLAVGVPGENSATGLVQVFYSHGPEGLIGAGGARDESVSQDTFNANGTSEAGDLFAAALATGDFDADDVDDLAVGVPGEDADSGLVQVFYSHGAAGLVTSAGGADDETLSQDTPNANGTGEAGDLFGAALPFSPCIVTACRIDAITPPASCLGEPATLEGTARDDSMIGTPAGDVLVGRQGNDSLAGAGGDDLLCGGKGDDTVVGGDGADHLHGGDGSDRLNGGRHADTMMGGGGADIMKGGNQDDTLSGDEGDDRLLGHGGLDLLDGGAGNDVLDGGPGADILLGGPGIDRLKGKDGVDRLDGGAGNDKLFGGPGADLFVFRAIDGVDVIFDWGVGADVIDLSGHAQFNDMGDVLAAARQSGVNVVIGGPPEPYRIVILNQRLDELTADDFVF